MNRLFVFLLFYFYDSLLNGQIVDSIIIKKVESLIIVSKEFASSKNYLKAIEINSIAEKVVLEKLGQESAAFGKICLHYGVIMYSKRDYLEAEKWYLLAKDIQERILGKHNVDYANTLNNLGILYWSKGDFIKSEPFFFEALAIRELVYGKFNSEYAKSLNNLAQLYTNLGKYDKAELFHVECKSIRQKVFGLQHPDYIGTLINLSSLYRNIGDFEKCEPLLLEAKALWEKFWDKLHPTYSAILINLGLLYYDLGQYEKAEVLYLTAKSIFETKTMDFNNPFYFNCIINLATLYQNLGNYPEAEALYIMAKDIQFKLYGKNHQNYATNLNNLGTLYKDMGQFEKAESLLIEAKDIRESVLGKEHDDYLYSLVQLAFLYLKNNNNAKAEILLLEAKSKQEEILGTEHPDYIWSLKGLTDLYIEYGKYDLAFNLVQRIFELNQGFIFKVNNFLSEKEMSQFLNRSLQVQDLSLSYASETRSNLVGKTCFDISLFYKGIILNSTLKIKQLALSNPGSVENLNQLKFYHRLLSIEYSKPKSVQRNLVELEIKVNNLEKELNRSNSDYREILTPVNWKQVQNMLRMGETAIEFVHFKNLIGSQTNINTYAALVLLPGDSFPHFVPLFDEEKLNQFLSNSQSRRMDYVADLYNLSIQRGALPNEITNSLYELIWKPLGPYLKRVTKIYFSPSGLLHRINQNAIAIDDKTLLSDRYDLIQLGSTRQLVIDDRRKVPKVVNASIYGGINFDVDSMDIMPKVQYRDSNSFSLRSELSFSNTDSTLRGGAWTYLHGSDHEVIEINKIFNKAGIKSNFFEGKKATEETFKKLGEYNKESPQIIHISTHGYFFPDPEVSRQSSFVSLQEEPVFKISEHPMLRSGLIMAGGNYAWKTGKPVYPDAEDGILTAYEISQLNLKNTELVVLSACETGLGDIQGNEGVYGLQRAFKIAGVRNLIMSLWQVPDQQTSELMTTFYRYWLIKKKSIRESLKLAQNDLRKQGLEPFYWAGFVLVE